MTFRIEEKVILHISDYFKILKIMGTENKNLRLFPSRKISSLYFDNKDNDMFVDAEEGNLPRKKIRIRTYPESDKKMFFLEKKINSFEGKFKTTEPINKNQFDDFIKRGIFDKTYNNCTQKFWVSYEREYFSYLGARFTVDKNINFQINNRFINTISDKIILEVKSKNLSIDIFDGKFPFMRSRFSKYCEGFKLMFN
tara:strand:+ start:912 stop:1502 length:591 start_codon:yes stop_codon:yes gene_type:complete